MIAVFIFVSLLEDFQDIEHGVPGEVPVSEPNRKISSSDSRRKRHIGAPDHGGYQRLIASGSMVTSLGEENNKGPTDSIDVVFTTYWQYPAKVRIILPEDKACIERFRNLSKAGKVLANILTFEGPGAYLAYVEFWAVFYFCSDQIDRKTFLCIFLLVFSSYANNVGNKRLLFVSPSTKELQRKPLGNLTFFAYVISREI